jgi:hypothetical protein
MTKIIRNAEIERHLEELKAEILKRISADVPFHIAQEAGIDPGALTKPKNEKSLDWKTFYRLLYVLNGGPPQIFPQQNNEPKALKTLRMIQNLLKDLEDFPS